MDTPRISVIIPAYNAQKYIAQSCESVFSQTYPNWELIVVDDGSVDDTWPILKELAADRDNMTVLHTENRGVSAARNTGMDAAKGAYISFLDADDVLTEDALEQLYSGLIESGCDIVIGNAESCSRWDGTQALVKSLEGHLATHSACEKLYKASFVQDIRFAEGRRVNEDVFFVFQCFLRQPIVGLIPACVYKVRQTPESASRSDFSEKYLDILYFAKERKRIIEEQYPELSYLTENLMLKANITLLRVLCRSYDPKWRRLEKECLAVIRAKKEHFRPAMKADERFLWIIEHGFFPLYKLRVYVIRELRKKYYRSKRDLWE